MNAPDLSPMKWAERLIVEWDRCAFKKEARAVLIANLTAHHNAVVEVCAKVAINQCAYKGGMPYSCDHTKVRRAILALKVKEDEP
mgnify:CR=1 FL=1